MPLESHANSARLPLSETKGNVQMESRDCALFLQHIVKTMNKTMQEHLFHHYTTATPLDGLSPWPDHGPGAQTDPQWYHSEENVAPEGRERKIQHLYSSKESTNSFRKSNISQSICRRNTNHTTVCAGYVTSIQTYFTKWMEKIPIKLTGSRINSPALEAP